MWFATPELGNTRPIVTIILVDAREVITRVFTMMPTRIFHIAC